MKTLSIKNKNNLQKNIKKVICRCECICKFEWFVRLKALEYNRTNELNSEIEKKNDEKWWKIQSQHKIKMNEKNSNEEVINI